MKKIVLVLSFVTVSCLGVYAQSSKEEVFTFGGGVTLGLPIGNNFKSGYNFGVGGQLQGEYQFNENVSGVATVGYTDFFGKSITINDGFDPPYTVKNKALGLIPILVGARFYPVEQFFVGAQIGYGIFTGGGGGAPKGFEYRPQIGYNAESFQVIFHYDGVSVTGGTLSHIGLTGIYKFGGK